MGIEIGFMGLDGRVEGDTRAVAIALQSMYAWIPRRSLGPTTAPGNLCKFKLVSLGFVCASFLTACSHGSGASSVAVSNPTPTIASITPNSATRGGAAFLLTVNGANFVSGAVVQWNGVTQPTTFVSGAQLSAQISSDNIGVAGTENVTVSNPAPGGGASNSVAFTIPCVLASPSQASAQTRARIGAYYFDGWAGPLTEFHFNGLVTGAYQDRQPLSGWRDDNQCAVERQLAWAHSFGIDFFVFDWFFNTPVNDAGNNEDLNSALKITHFLADRHGMKFAILYVNQPPFIIATSADWASAVSEWVSYMTDSEYVLVNGKPFFMVIDLYAMRQTFGSSDAVKAAFGQLRAAAQAHGFPGVYIVGGFDFIGGSPVPAGTASVDGIFPDLSMAAADGYDAISIYDYASGLQNLGTVAGLQPYAALSDTGHWTWNQGALKSPLAFIPVAMDGWDPRPNPPPSPSAFWVGHNPQASTSLIRDAITWAESNPALRPEPSPSPPIVLIQAWNELLQGSMMVPTVGDTTSFGDSLAALLSASPTEVRSVLTLSDSGPSVSNRVASGSLIDANGVPVANATVTVQYIPIDGSYTQYRLSGVAPTGAVQAIVGFRVNEDYPATWPGFWFAGPGNCNISFYQASYIQPADGIQRVPNGDFSLGAQSWTLQGQSQLVASDRGAGQMVQVVAASNQSAMLDSVPFSVTGGASFQASFYARIPPASSGSGYLLVAFKDGSGNFLPIPGPNPNDLKSETIQFAAGELAVGSATTDSAGKYQLSLASLGTSQFILKAIYNGDSQYWPAYVAGP